MKPSVVIEYIFQYYLCKHFMECSQDIVALRYQPPLYICVYFDTRFWLAIGMKSRSANARKRRPSGYCSDSRACARCLGGVDDFGKISRSKSRGKKTK